MLIRHSSAQPHQVMLLSPWTWMLYPADDRRGRQGQAAQRFLCLGGGQRRAYRHAEEEHSSGEDADAGGLGGENQAFCAIFDAASNRQREARRRGPRSAWRCFG